LAKALENANQAISLRGEMKDMNGLNFAYDTKSQIELASGDAVGALASYQEHIRYRDSVFNTEKAKEINRRELQYEFGKREDSIKYQQLLTNEKLVQQELLGKQQQQQLSLKQQQLLLINKEKTCRNSPTCKNRRNCSGKRRSRLPYSRRTSYRPGWQERQAISGSLRSSYR
jgi:hypothetical protein